MNVRFKAVPITALSLCLAAGAVWAAGSPTQLAQPPASAPSNGVAAQDFRSCHWVEGRDVVDSAGQDVGDVTDLILDRGSGRIEYLVLKTDATRGSSGRTVSIPYSAFRWNAAKDRLVLTASPEQLKMYPEFSAARWSETMEAHEGAQVVKNGRDMKDGDKRDGANLSGDRDSKNNVNAKNDRGSKNAHDANETQEARNAREVQESQNPKDPRNKPQGSRDSTPVPMESDPGHDRMLPDSPSASNLYAGRYDTSKQVHIEGEVTGVERVRNSLSEEELIVTVAAADGTTKRVSVGPSWYIAGGAAAPMRGDKLIAETYPVGGDRDLYTASHVRIGDRKLRVRDDKGEPAWGASTMEAGGHNYRTSYMHYVLASNLRGMKVECQGAKCGTVDEVIVDRNSGEAAFLSIDPDQNFLGINDTKRLIPWTVATVTADKIVRIDASKEMVIAGGETPSDLSALNNRTRSDAVYTAYRVPAPKFEADRDRAASANQTSEAWGTRGTIIGALERNSAKTMTGKIIDISEMTFDDGTSPARAFKIRSDSDGGTDETVLIGPLAYVEGQKNMCKPGDTVTIEASRTRINGKSYWLARSVDCKSTKVVYIDGSDAPSWGTP